MIIFYRRQQGSDAKREARRGYGIRGIIGGNGQGKSALMVHDVWPSLDAGRPVLSTLRLLDIDNPRQCDDSECNWVGHPEHQAAHPLWVPFTQWEQFLEFSDGDVLLDEVAGVASSRESSNLPFQVANKLQQLRRANITLTWTAPGWMRADRIIRECTQLVIECKGKFAKTIRDDTAAKAWPDRRLFRWDSYEATDYDGWTKGTKDEVVKISTDWLWRPGHKVETQYDTLAHVSSLGWALSTGICLGCGGKRSIPRCKCSGEPGRTKSEGDPLHGNQVVSLHPIPQRNRDHRTDKGLS